jgi:NADH-quinone oxidoreductase subunit J
MKSQTQIYQEKLNFYANLLENIIRQSAVENPINNSFFPLIFNPESEMAFWANKSNEEITVIINQLRERPLSVDSEQLIISFFDLNSESALFSEDSLSLKTVIEAYSILDSNYFTNFNNLLMSFEPQMNTRTEFVNFWDFFFLNGKSMATCCLLFAILFCAMAVIYSKNPVHSILFLILVFFAASSLLLLYDFEFLALIFMIVYVGAIAVLFLFVIMMLNIRVLELSDDFLKYFPLLAIVSLSFFFTISRNYSQFQIIDSFYLNCDYLDIIKDSYYLLASFDHLSVTNSEFVKFYQQLNEFELPVQARDRLNLENELNAWTRFFFEVKELTSLSQMLYVNYVSLFWLAGLILLVSMIGAIVLTIHSNFATKKQLIFKQLSREYKKTIKYLN